MDSARFPTEQEQYEAYRLFAEKLNGKACDYKTDMKLGTRNCLIRFA